MIRKKKEAVLSPVTSGPVRPDNVLDVGCSIMLWKIARSIVHKNGELYLRCFERLKRKVDGEVDRDYVQVQGARAETVKVGPAKAADTAFLENDEARGS